MGQTLTNGVYLPDKGERNCYNGLAANWQILDNSVGTIAEHTTALSGKAPVVHTHTKADITDFPAYGNAAGTICEGNDSRLSDARTPVAHTHVTADVTDFPDMELYPYKLAYTTNGGNFPYINLVGSDHIALGFNGITDTGIYKVRATADVPGTPNALTMDGILVVFNSDGTANVSSHRRCQQIFYQNSTTPKIFKRIGVFNITSQTWNWDTYKWVEYANTGRDFIPNETNSLNIGSSSNQWNNLYAKKVNTQSVNGVNPGALSLPDKSFESINSKIYNPSDQLGAIDLNGGANYWTSDCDCYICFYTKNDRFSWIQIYWPNTSVCLGQTYTPVPNETSDYSGFIPVAANTKVIIKIKGTVAPTFRRVPCQGNV